MRREQLSVDFNQHPRLDTTQTERRTSARATTVFTIGRIRIGQLIRPCMVRDVSRGGLRIQMTNPPPPGSCVEVEARGITSRLATVRWVGDREAGLAFDFDRDISQIIDGGRSRTGYQPRNPRFDLIHSIDFSTGGRELSAQILNISLGGVKLTTSSNLAPGDRANVRLNLDLAFDCLASEVRWAQGGVCGIQFLRPISSLALALALEGLDQAQLIRKPAIDRRNRYTASKPCIVN